MQPQPQLHKLVKKYNENAKVNYSPVSETNFLDNALIVSSKIHGIVHVVSDVTIKSIRFIGWTKTDHVYAPV